jgi:hypothetical protein
MKGTYADYGKFTPEPNDPGTEFNQVFLGNYTSASPVSRPSMRNSRIALPLEDMFMGLHERTLRIRNHEGEVAGHPLAMVMYRRAVWDELVMAMEWNVVDNECDLRGRDNALEWPHSNKGYEYYSLVLRIGDYREKVQQHLVRGDEMDNTSGVYLETIKAHISDIYSYTECFINTGHRVGVGFQNPTRVCWDIMGSVTGTADRCLAELLLIMNVMDYGRMAWAPTTGGARDDADLRIQILLNQRIRAEIDAIDNSYSD